MIIYNEVATTADEARDCFVRWLREQEADAGRMALHAKLQRDVAHHLAVRGTFERIADRWERVQFLAPQEEKA